MFHHAKATFGNYSRYAGLMLRHQFDREGRTCPRLEIHARRVAMVIPGFLGPVSVTRPLQIRFERSGIPAFGFNLSLRSLLPLRAIVPLIRRAVDDVRDAHPSLERIDIVGHSMGGIIAVTAIEQGVFDGLEVRLVTLGSPFFGTYAASVGWFVPGAYDLLPHVRTARVRPLSVLSPEKFLSIAGSLDTLAPAERCTHPSALYAVMPVDHAGLLLRRDVFRRALDHLSLP